MTDMNFDTARFNMVEQQIRPWDVLDPRILELFQTLPREKFVPEGRERLAFIDEQIPIGDGQVMMEPRLEARLLQSVDPQPDETALEIGAGTGFLAACLGSLCAGVTSVDIRPAMLDTARKNLAANGIDNVTLVEGDAAQGWDDGRRYDVIVLSGSLPEYVEAFQEQLTVGGRLFVIVGETPAMEALLVTRMEERQWTTESLFETGIKPLDNARRTLKFAL